MGTSHADACSQRVAFTARNLITFAGMTLAASGAAWAGPTPVSATPGTYTGVITFIATVTATSVEVDARDTTGQYTATANATQNDPVNCPAGSQYWCYSIVVESALANAYYLRPIAYISESTPVFIDNRIPFSVFGPVSITPTQTVSYNMSYTPGEISGTVSGNDLSNNPLQVYNYYFSFWDTVNALNEPCGGSVEFCPFNSVDAGSGLTLPAQTTYQDFLKPSDSYLYGTRAIGFQETGQATTTIQFDGGQTLLSTPAAGVNMTQNYTLNQVAAITGTFSAPGQSIYNFEITVEGATNENGSFYELYNQYPQYIPSTPLSQPVPFTLRIFDLADLTQPVNIVPLLILSPDGTTNVEYPAQAVTGLTPGATVQTNYSASAGTISGRVTFSPPYPAGNIYPGIQAVTNDGGEAEAQFTPDPQGGTYTMPAFADTWTYWRFGWNFTLPNPNFTSNYLVGQYLTAPQVPVVTLTNGENLTGNDFTFATALVRVLFTAPSTPTGTTITDPQLAIVTGGYNGTTFKPDYVETGNAEGLGYNSVFNAESDTVLRVHGVPFQITPSAIINPGGVTGTGRTTFSPVVVNPNQGDIIVIGVPGTLSLTVNSPQNGQTLNTCQIPVTGTSTGAPDITITVNGQPATTTSANNPNDPNQVDFSATVPCTGASTQITVVSSAPGNTSVSYTLTVNNTQVATSTTVTSTPNPSQYGQPVTFTATVTATGGGSPSGSVQFLDNSTPIGSGILNSGVATFTPTSPLSVGAHPITAVYATNSSYSGSTSGIYTQNVTPAPLVITASSPTMSYGGAVPAITPSYSGFVAGDSAASLTTQPTCTTTATSTSNVGSYPTNCSGAADPDYNITYAPGVLTIVQAVLTVTATSETEVYGSVDQDHCGNVNQHLTYTITGFVNGQTRNQVLTGSPCESTTATPKSGVGTYPITITQCSLQLNNTLGKNYTLAFVNGTLTVTPATLYVVANSYSRPVNKPNPVFGYTISGFVNGDTQWSALTGAPACCTTIATQSSPAGDYTIVIGLGTLAAKNGNYTIELVNGLLIIYNPGNGGDQHCDGHGKYQSNPQYDRDNWPDSSSYNYYWGKGGNGPNIIVGQW